MYAIYTKQDDASDNAGNYKYEDQKYWHAAHRFKASVFFGCERKNEYNISFTIKGSYEIVSTTNTAALARSFSVCYIFFFYNNIRSQN